MGSSPPPPRLARRVLARSLPTNRRDDIVADLDEVFRRRCRTHSPFRARIWYHAEVISFTIRFAAEALRERRPGVGRRPRVHFGDLVADVRHVIRSLRRQPGFTVVVTITLSLAIGANAAVFGIIDRLLLRGPEHVQDSHRVARVYGHVNTPPQGHRTFDTFGYVTYADLRDRAMTLEGIAAYSTGSVVSGEGAGAQVLRVAYTTWDYFPLLGVQPQLGRFYGPEEDQPPRGLSVVVLDDGYWRRAYGADTTVIGQTLDARGEEFIIIGIAPPRFTGVELAPIDLWFPMAVRGRTMRDDWATTRRASWLRIVGRLAPAETHRRASQEIASIHTSVAMEAAPDEVRSAAQLELLPLGRDSAGQVPAEAAVARWLVGVATIVLLIAIANVSSLQLARGTKRRREVAVRIALGIDRGRLLRLFLIESLALSTAGTVLGLAVAHYGALAIRAVLLPQIAWTTSPVNHRVLLMATLATVIVGIAVGAAPALVATRTELTRSLKSGARDGGNTSPLQALLLIPQAGLALVLLIGAGLFVQSLARIGDTEMGFEPDRALSADVYWPSSGGAPPDERRRLEASRDQFAREARDHFARLPWVASAGLAIGLPFQSSYGVRTRPRGAESLPDFIGDGPNIMAVSPEYFTTVGATRVRGRLFNAGDVFGSEPVTVVNESMARVFWPGADALGQCVTLYEEPPEPCVRVVGVVRDAKQWSLRETTTLQLYVPIQQAREISGPVLVVRPIGNAEASIERVRAELLAMRPDLPYTNIRTLQSRIDPQIRPWRLGAMLFSLFGALALTVAGVGLYSILAYLVEQRRREFGVRAALGASTGNIVTQTIKRGLVPSFAGLALGAILALGLGPWLQPRLYETSARDPVVFAGAAGLLLLVALLGTVVPARRAARVDPMVALREE